MKTQRHSAGSYTVRSGAYTVNVTRFEHLRGQQWIAAATWDRYLYTDPMWTKREAVEQAAIMINQRTEERN